MVEQYIDSTLVDITALTHQRYTPNGHAVAALL